jgi:peroxiredoxin
MALALRSGLIPWLLIGVAAAVALAAGFLVAERTGNPMTAPATPGAPDALLGITLPDASGKQEALGQWRGKVLVVNFWATWCTPCREEMPEFVTVQRELGGRGLQFVGIAIDEPAKVRQFADEIGLNYPSLIGGYGAIELSKSLGNKVGALPFTLILDRSGAVAHTQLGPLREAKLRSIVAQLL